MKTPITLSILAALVLSLSCTRKPRFTPPLPEQVATMLEFAGPVELSLKIASPEELARVSEDKGEPLASFYYSDPTHSSESIIITVWVAGTYFGENRAEFNQWLQNNTIPASEGSPAIGIFQTRDGRAVYQFRLGFGPGGSAYGALLPCRDSRYELVLIEQSNFHDEEDGKQYAHHVSPKKDLKDVIEAFEKLIFP